MPALVCPNININPLRLTQFQFQIEKLPDLTYFVQSVQVPEISLGVSTQATSVHDLKIPGETLEYSSLTVEFIVDEELKNWNAIYFWMVAMGYPEGHQLYTQYMEQNVNKSRASELSKGYSDGSLMLLDSANSPKQVFTFVDMFPISLSGFQFNQSSTSADVATAQATFEYSYYTINKTMHDVYP